MNFSNILICSGCWWMSCIFCIFSRCHCPFLSLANHSNIGVLSNACSPNEHLSHSKEHKSHWSMLDRGECCGTTYESIHCHHLSAYLHSIISVVTLVGLRDFFIAPYMWIVQNLQMVVCSILINSLVLGLCNSLNGSFSYNIILTQLFYVENLPLFYKVIHVWW